MDLGHFSVIVPGGGIYRLREGVIMYAIRLLLAVLVVLVPIGRAYAIDQLVVGRSTATAITFTPLEIGERAGIWKQNGLSLKVISFSGDAQMQQALTAGTVQIGLGSGPALAFMAKGVPAKAIGAFGGRPYDLCLVIAASSGIRSVEGLKGKRIGVTSLGSLSHWLVLETSRRYGWTGRDALVPVPLGTTRAQLAAMTRGQISGHVTTSVQGFTHEAAGTGQIALNFGELLTDFITHVFFARNDLIAGKPDVARRFLTGWQQTVTYMREHKDESVRLVAASLNLKPQIVAKSYPFVMATLSNDSRFDPKALSVLSRSFVELGILPREPDMAALYTNQFLPAAR